MAATSTDGGKTWTKPGMNGLGDAPFDLAVDPRNPEHSSNSSKRNCSSAALMRADLEPEV